MAALGVARVGDVQLPAKAATDLVVTAIDDVDRDALMDGRLVRVPGRRTVPPGVRAR